MAGLGIRLYTDEMIHAGLAAALRRLGYDAESCEEAGRSNQGIPDPAQLAYATHDGRAILTFNIGDFVRLDAQAKAAGDSHAGIIVSPAIESFSELLRRVRHHLDTYPPEVQHDTVLWLSSAPGP
jgi:hypothetical protein